MVGRRVDDVRAYEKKRQRIDRRKYLLLASRNKRTHFSRINGGTVLSISRRRYVPLRAPTRHKVAITVNYEKKNRWETTRCTDKGKEERKKDCKFTDLNSDFATGRVIKSFVIELIKKHLWVPDFGFEWSRWNIAIKILKTYMFRCEHT